MPDSPPTADPKVGQTPVASKPVSIEDRLAGLEAAVASLGEVHLTQEHDGLTAYREWYDAYEEAERADEPPAP